MQEANDQLICLRRCLRDASALVTRHYLQGPLGLVAILGQLNLVMTLPIRNRRGSNGLVAVEEEILGYERGDTATPMTCETLAGGEVNPVVMRYGRDIQRYFTGSLCA